jgi:TonB family protein
MNRKYLISYILALMPFLCGAQEAENIYGKHYTKAMFCCSRNGVDSFVAKNIVYPMADRENMVEGIVEVRFTIDEFGYMMNPAVYKSLSPACDKEALRVVTAMERWEPAIYKGKAVTSTHVIKVKFVLE